MTRRWQSFRFVLAFAGAVAGFASGGIVSAAEATATAPDFSGRYGRNAFNFEPLPNAPQPVINLSRMPNGASNIGQLVGDFRNPILRPETAEIIRQKGQISLSGHAYAMVDRYGSPVTSALHVVERYRLIDGTTAREAQERYEKFDGRLNAAPRPLDPDLSKKGLQIFVTVEDPNVFTTAWSGTVTYRPMAASMAWLEQVCAENPNEYYKDRWIGLPKADRPDF